MLTQEIIDNLRFKAVATPSMIIDGKACGANEVLPIISPLDGSTIAQLPMAQEIDVNAAVSAARQSFDKGIWADMAPKARKKILLQWANLIEQNAIEIAVLGVRDNGTEIAMASKAEPLSAAETIRFYAEACDKVYGEIAPTAPDSLGLIHKEAIGVVGVIVPWNFPMMIGAWKLAPALATGNSVVIKPSETASLSLIRMVELAHEAGLPDGVLNIVTGDGNTAGSALARSMDVDVLVFTGSGATGRKLLEASAQSNLKRVYLELGGKSPHIIFDDCDDLDAAATAVIGGIFRNAGQVCIAGSRLLVQRSIHAALMDKIITLTRALRVGDPLNINTQVGALNSESHMDSILKMLDGSNPVIGGKRVLHDTGGFYIEPAIVTDVEQGDALFQEEVFGPVLSVTAFDDEESAVRLANATQFGLSAGVWTGSLSRAHRMVAAIKSGVVHVNTYGGADNTVPMGGFKQSGNGYDKSLYALDKFINHKTAWFKL